MEKTDIEVKQEEEERAPAPSVERVFDGVRVLARREQVTVRALVVSLGLSVMLSVIVMKLNLTTGIIPSLNVASGLLGFFFVKVWTKALERAGVLRVPWPSPAKRTPSSRPASLLPMASPSAVRYLSNKLK
ncbi:hypothetical protein ZIOFF_030280 [Zingiber officinale]|uniref:Uncharacterized protein n=1 Tax=Zingiber officinale TaxID=94328 RepID=A0A8J5GZN2_ZINOF|nr:hypothetical protein ZIOFF_030280 [Zingiber officinale]